jgi:MFS transporter, DHA1 family, multidrug resistance protein
MTDTATSIRPMRRLTTIDHIDSCHVPDDDERHHPPTEPHSTLATPERRQSHDGSNRSSNATFVNRDDPRDVEKATQRRPSNRVDEQVLAEERKWKDDIVMFDSKIDMDNPKNVIKLLQLYLCKSDKLIHSSLVVFSP